MDIKIINGIVIVNSKDMIIKDVQAAIEKLNEGENNV